METSEQLLRLIVRLQSVESMAQGRQMLLKYARRASGAQFAIIFTLDQEHQTLMLLDYNGRRPPHTQPDIAYISVNGLFGSGLLTQRLLYSTDFSSDPRTLPEERAWGWSGGRILLSAIKTGQQTGGEHGVLVLCFDPAIKRHSSGGRADTPENEGDLLFCSMLLSAYLSHTEARTPAASRPPQRIKRAARTALALQETAEDPDQQHKQPEVIHDLSELYTMGLLQNYEIRAQGQQTAIEYERKRIALDIHDGAAQHITHALHKLELIGRTLEQSSSEMLLVEINRVHTLLEIALQDLRHSISSLLPAQIEEHGLAAALYTLLDEYRVNEPGVEIVCDIDTTELWPPILEGVVFRFIQEALNNARKHAEASRIAIHVRMLSNTIVVEVSDNGRGFAVGASMQTRESSTGTGEHLGLRTMSGRIQEVGGSWEVQSKPGEGTIVRARFPLVHSSVGLTEREGEVLRLLVEGLTNRAIAQQLSVSVETVKSHVHHIMQKMQVKDRTQAAVLAARQQLLY